MSFYTIEEKVKNRKKKMLNNNVRINRFSICSIVVLIHQFDIFFLNQ